MLLKYFVNFLIFKKIRVNLKNKMKINNFPYLFTLKLFCQNASIAAQLVGVGIIIHYEMWRLKLCTLYYKIQLSRNASSTAERLKTHV